MEARKDQLRNLYKMLEENSEQIFDALYKDLHKVCGVVCVFSWTWTFNINSRVYLTIDGSCSSSVVVFFFSV